MPVTKLKSVEMNSSETYISDRSKLLNRYGLGMLLMPQDVAVTNPWFMVFEPQLDALVDQVGKGLMRFCFSADHRVQAYAIHDEQAIVLAAGMFDLLCKLTASMVSSGLYPAVGASSLAAWEPDIKNNLLSVRGSLEEGTFNWSDGPSWARDPDRLELFFQILRTMVRFVVLHETGHLWHRHGERHRQGHRIEVDSNSPNRLPQEKALESQARELLADQFAFRLLIQGQHGENQGVFANPSADNLRCTLLRSPRDEIAFYLLVVYFYFYAVDRLDWSVGDAHLYSHPPAPFRLKALIADLFEFGALGVQQEECKSVISDACLVANAAVATTFRRFPDMNWMESMADPHLYEHFTNLCREIPKWRRAE